MSAHAVEQYQQRVKPALDLDAARGELERLVGVAQVTAVEPRWVHAANPARFYLLIGDAVALPLVAQDGGWVATTCVAAGTYTPVRRAQRAAYKASQAREAPHPPLSRRSARHGRLARPGQRRGDAERVV